MEWFWRVIFLFVVYVTVEKMQVEMLAQLLWKELKNIPLLLLERSMESDDPSVVSVGIVGTLRSQAS